MRSFYSASKFALDGFGKALHGEVQHKNISVLQVYPGYIHTNISNNSLVGDSQTFGKTDSNIKNGLPADQAASDIIKAIYLKQFTLTVGKSHLKFWLIPRIL